MSAQKKDAAAGAWASFETTNHVLKNNNSQKKAQAGSNVPFDGIAEAIRAQEAGKQFVGDLATQPSPPAALYALVHEHLDDAEFLKNFLRAVQKSLERGVTMIPVSFVNHCKSPVVSACAMQWEEISALLAQCDAGEKDGAGWLPADIPPGTRNGARVKSVSMMVLDVEAATKMVNGGKTVIGPEPPSASAMRAELALWGWQCIFHTTFQHEDEHPRYRLTFKLSRPLAPTEVKPLGSCVAHHLGLSDCIDRKALEPARFFYLPRRPKGSLDQFIYFALNGQALAVDDLIAEAKRVDEAAKASPRPPHERSGENVIAAFNAAHDIGMLLEKNGYIAKGRARWVWPGSTTGQPGARLLPNSSPPKIYSSHGGDPLADGHGHDCFDVFRILQHNGDLTAAVRAAASLLGLNPKHGPASGADHDGWGDPEPIPDALPPVEPFDYDMLPISLRGWIQDISERVQCPPDFPAVGAMISLAAVVGRKIGIRPKRFDDWLEVPSLWGAIIGRPGVMKSPALRESMRPLRRLEQAALQSFEAESKEWRLDNELHKLKREAEKLNIKKAYGRGKTIDADALSAEIGDDEPHARRYVVNDCSVEALGEILRHNPNGTLAYRDELIGLLKSLDREERRSA